MLELFIANKNYSSWSLRPWLLMRELNIPFTEQLVHFDDESQPDAFRSFSPSGKVPCLIDETTVVWDSLAIVEYLAEKTPQVFPSDTTARAWSRSVMAEMHSGFFALRHSCTMNCGLRIRLDTYTPELQKNIVRLDELWGEGLNRFGGNYLAGNSFTAVDAFFAPVAFRIQTYGLTLSPEALAYGQRLLVLPAGMPLHCLRLGVMKRMKKWREMERGCMIIVLLLLKNI